TDLESNVAYKRRCVFSVYSVISLLCGQRQGQPAAVEVILDFDILVHGVDFVLTGAESDGRNAVTDKPVGVEAAIGDAEARRPARAFGRGLRRAHHWAVFLKAKRVVVEAGLEADLGGAAVHVDHLLGRVFKRGAIRPRDRAHEAGVVAPRLAADQGVIRDDVG